MRKGNPGKGSRRELLLVLGLILHSSLITHHCFSQVITTVAGSGFVFRGDGGPAVNAPLGLVGKVVIDSHGNVYASDALHHLVVKIPTTGILTVVAGNGVIVPGSSGDGGPATSASLDPRILGLAVDATGNLYVADAAFGVEVTRIRKVSSSGIITTAIGAGLYRPWDVAVDSAGNLYMSQEDHRIRKFSSDGTITTVAGNGTRGFSGDGGPATAASLSQPLGIALDLAGNLYIADQYNYRIRKVSPSGIISTVAGNGTRGFSGDGGPATAASLVPTARYCPGFGRQPLHRRPIQLPHPQSQPRRNHHHICRQRTVQILW